MKGSETLIGRLFTAVTVAIILPAVASAESALAGRLLSSDKQVQAAAKQELSTLPTEERVKVVPALIDKLNDTDQSFVAGETLVLIGQEAVLELIRTLQQPNGAGKSQEISEVLGKIGPAALPPLLKILQEGQGEVVGWAALALAEMGEAAKPVVPDMIRRLRDPDGQLEYRVVLALEELGPVAHEAAPALIRALHESGPDDRSDIIIEALGAIGSEEAVPVLIAALKDPTRNGDAAEALGQFGPKAKSAVPALIEALDDDGWTQLKAVESLGKIGPDAAAAVPALIRLYSSGGDTIQSHVIYALAGIGPAAEPAVPLIVSKLNDPRTILVTKCGYAEVLKRINTPKALEAVQKFYQEYPGLAEQYEGLKKAFSNE